MEALTAKLLDQHVHNIGPDGDADYGVSKVIELTIFKKNEQYLSDSTGLSIPIKPTWPYEELVITEGSDVKENLEQKSETKSISHKTDSIENALTESSLIRQLILKSQDTIEIDAEYGNFVRETVKKCIHNSLDELKAKYIMFKDSFFVEVGSMAEGTRIVEPSEMDFLIALPELANAKNCNIYFVDSKMAIFIQDDLRKEMRSWIKKFPTDPIFPGSGANDLHLFYFLRGALELAIKNNIPDGISILPENKFHDNSRKKEKGKARSSMFHFGIECKGRRRLYLSVDLCFSVPLDAQRIENIVIKSDPNYLQYIHNICTERSTLVCAVLHLSSLCVVADRYHFVKSVTKFNEHVDAKKCYKTAKYFIKLFLPSVEEDDCFICSKSIISSYAIKTIIFYMMEFYTDPNYWNEEYHGNRLIEVFEILLYSQFTLRDNICYLWRIIEIPNETGPFKHVPCREKANDFLATDDVYILGKVSAFWQLMETKTDSKELIKQFLNLLKCLRDSNDRETSIYSRN